MRKLRKHLEPPRIRKVRKAKEYKMAVMRTMWSTVSGICGVIGLMFGTLTLCKVMGWIP